MTTDYDELIDAGRVTPTVAEQMMANENKRVVRWFERKQALSTLCVCDSCRRIRGEPLAETDERNTISRPMQRKARTRHRYNPPPP